MKICTINNSLLKLRRTSFYPSYKVFGQGKVEKVDFGKCPMATIIRVPTFINFLEISHGYGNYDAYGYSEVKSTCRAFRRPRTGHRTGFEAGTF